jgi:hypothetical protein
VLPDGIFFKPKTPIWVNFARSCNETFCYFYGHFVYFMDKWYILCPFGTFGTFFDVLVCNAQKIWQPWRALTQFREKEFYVRPSLITTGLF